NAVNRPVGPPPIIVVSYISSSINTSSPYKNGRDFKFLLKEFTINFNITLFTFWNVFFSIDSFHRTYFFTGTAINTYIRINVKHVLSFLNTIHWAYFLALAGFFTYTG